MERYGGHMINQKYFMAKDILNFFYKIEEKEEYKE